MDFDPSKAKSIPVSWGLAELGLELRDAALEEDDLLQRAPEDPLRVDHLTDALRPVRHSPAVAAVRAATQSRIPP